MTKNELEDTFDKLFCKNLKTGTCKKESKKVSKESKEKSEEYKRMEEKIDSFIKSLSASDLDEVRRMIYF